MENLDINKLQARDENELRKLFIALLPRVRLIAHRYAGPTASDQMDDIVQDSILKIYTNLPKYDAERGDFWRWCHSIIKNVAFDAIRLNRRKSARLSPIEDNFRVDLPAVQSPVDSYRLLNESLQLLPPKSRHIMVMRLQGFSFEEIAGELNEEHDTIRNLYYRALVKLKRLLLTEAGGASEEVGK